MKASAWIQSHEQALRWSASAYRRTAELRRRRLGSIDIRLRAGTIAEAAPERICPTEYTSPDFKEIRSLLEQEQELERVLLDVVSQHPAWPWLEKIPGLNRPAAADLLARLSIRRARCPSAFWSFCGFATLPGVVYQCPRCEAKRTILSTSAPPARHKTPDESQTCSGRMRRIDSRAVERLPQAPGSSTQGGFDADAKRLCYTIATGLREANHCYDHYYRYQRQILEITRSEWPDSRRHMNALRRMQKLFLAHLWVVWREALKLPITQPNSEGGEHPWMLPWTMVDHTSPSE